MGGWKEGLQYMSRGVTFIKSATAFAVLAVASAPPMYCYIPDLITTTITYLPL